MLSRLKPNDRLELFGNTWRVEANPFNQDIPFLQEGRKASICALRNSHGDCAAFKIFKNLFQDPGMEQICAGIRPFSSIPGMSACSRRVISPANHPQLLAKYPDFLYSVLMPWISGKLWCEVLLLSLQQKSPILSPDQSLVLATKFTQTMKELEDRRIAHTDVSSGNVIVDFDTSQVSLIDVEDIYAPTLRKPSVITAGTIGYQHATSTNGLWRQEADRFAGAVLIIEILALSKSNIVPLIYGESLFDPQELQNPLSPRYFEVTKMLKKHHPLLVPLWEQAWSASSLTHCPKLSDWHLALQKKARKARAVVTRSFTPVIGWTAPITIPSKPVPNPASEIVVGWQPIKLPKLQMSERLFIDASCFFIETASEKIGFVLGSFLGLLIGGLIDQKLNISLFVPLGVIVGCFEGFVIGRVLENGLYLGI